MLPKSIAFNHIPFYEMDQAYKLIGKSEDAKYISGTTNEDMCFNVESNGLFEAF